jgi:hypothetical protein
MRHSPRATAGVSGPLGRAAPTRARMAWTDGVLMRVDAAPEADTVRRQWLTKG